MLTIKLLNGLDLSGKTSIALEMKNRDKNKYIIHRKFISNISVLDDMQKTSVFMSDPYQFAPLLIDLIQKDIANLKNGMFLSAAEVLIQDSLWPIKYAAKLLIDDIYDYYDVAHRIITEMEKYPTMDSYYFYVEYEERKRRFLNMQVESAKFTPFDRIVMNEKLFSLLENQYKDILWELFPNTKFVDTTRLNIRDVVNYLENEFEHDDI